MEKVSVRVMEKVSVRVGNNTKVFTDTIARIAGNLRLK